MAGFMTHCACMLVLFDLIHRTRVGSRAEFRLKSPADDPLRRDPEHFRIKTGDDRLTARLQQFDFAADLDAAYLPGIEGDDVIDHHGHPRIVLNVAPFLAPIMFRSLAKVIYFIIN